MDPILEQLVNIANRDGHLAPIPPYTVEPCRAGGFKVTSPRGVEYWVQLMDGEPVSCTCAHFKYQGSCKHMLMV